MTITDLCNGDTLYIIPQTIKIGDFGLPTLSCPLSTHYCPIVEEDIMLFGVDPFECTGTVEVPLPDFRGFCSDVHRAQWAYFTEIIRVEDTTVIDTLFAEDARDIANLERGDYFIHYVAFDVNGRTVETTCRMRVADLQVPTAICRSSINVYLNEEGEGLVLASQLDQASYDNCDDLELLSRRYFDADFTDCSTLDEAFYGQWSDGVFVNCCDAGSTILAQLRIMDRDSNINGCNVQIHVMDTIAPVLGGLSAVTVSCNDLPDSFNPLDSLQRIQLFGMPAVVDNCPVILVETMPEVVGDQCQPSMMIRHFLATDRVGNTNASYEQVIQIQRDNSYQIRLPEDVITDCTDGLNTLRIEGVACGDFQVTYQDDELPASTDACLRIQRTWRIVNGCTYDGISAPAVIARNEDCAQPAGSMPVWLVVNQGAAFIDADSLATNQYPPAGTCDNPDGYWRSVPNIGAWEYVQIIEIVDQTPPAIAVELPQPICAPDATCEGLLSLPFTVLEDCPQERISVRVLWDEGNDGTIDEDLTATGILQGFAPDYRLEGRFLIGEHALVLEVADGCQNTVLERIPFEIVDCYIATPVCRTGITVNLTPVIPAADLNGDGILDEGAAIMSATMLAEQAEADCLGNVHYAVAKVGTLVNFAQDNLVLTCEDRYTAVRELVVFDNAYNPYAIQPDGSIGGPNYSTCLVTISVQDDDQVCNSCTQAELEIEGVIRNRFDNPMSNVSVGVFINEVYDQEVITVQDGKFEFADLTFSANYEVKPYKNDDTRNGVTTIDMILLQRHLLLQQIITDPYTLLAADVNRDGEVTTLDLIFIRQLLLDRIETWPNNTSWRFIPADFPLTDISAEIPDSYNYFNLNVCQFEQDFIGIKIGDLNGSANPAGFSTIAEVGRGSWSLWAQQMQLEAEGVFRIPIWLDDVPSAAGLQLNVNLPTAIARVIEIEPGLITPEWMNTDWLSRGQLKTRWVADASTKDAATQPLFTLVVKAYQDAKLSDWMSISTDEHSLVYDQSLAAYTPAFSFMGQGASTLLLLPIHPIHS
ncbi:MAG: dockerin type I domain-containing protein [Saprospiraceae bacterium]